MNSFGFDNVRVRHHGTIATIEVPQERISEVMILADTILPEICSLGFNHCEIDKEGLVSGKLNRALQS